MPGEICAVMSKSLVCRAATPHAALWPLAVSAAHAELAAMRSWLQTIKLMPLRRGAACCCARRGATTLRSAGRPRGRKPAARLAVTATVPGIVVAQLRHCQWQGAAARASSFASRLALHR